MSDLLEQMEACKLVQRHNVKDEFISWSDVMEAINNAIRLAEGRETE